MRNVLAVVFLLLGWCAPIPPAHAEPAVSVVVVRAGDAAVAKTSFATVPGAPYVVVASGAYQNFITADDDGQADCAWWFDRVGARYANVNVTVDGKPAGCQGQPYSPAHTYTWTEIGTGLPFRFAIGNTQPLVYNGAITFTVEGERQRTYAVDTHCVPHPAQSALLSYVPVVVEAGAQANESEWAASTYVVCDAMGSNGEHVLVRLGLPGAVVETADRMTAAHGDTVHVCWYGGATWGPTPYDVTTATQCADYTV